MIKIKRRAYLIVPKLVEQPTWGGSYIAKKKSWQNLAPVKGKKIGQSYELYGQSKLVINLDDSRHPLFNPEFSSSPKSPPLPENHQLDRLISFYPRETIGIKPSQKFKKMPLLIKFTQAFGNSFQLHIRPGIKNDHWMPKPESWYFLEKGLVTLGVRDNIDIKDFKKTCLLIEKQMTIIAAKVFNKKISLKEARKETADFIYRHDPHNYVNQYSIKKHQLIDLSMGGIHHSWEEDKENLPQGNIVYEIQLDVADSVSTIRCYDQGKIKDDGHLRKLNIDDYFRYLDTDKTNNQFDRLSSEKRGDCLLSTDYYHLSHIDLKEDHLFNTKDNFAHLFVEKGGVQILANDGELTVYEGHSCFVPAFTGRVKLVPLEKGSVLLKTTL